MTAKRVHDVSDEYEEARPASDNDIARIKHAATGLRTGRLEKNVDALLGAKGLRLDEALATPKPRRHLR